MKYEPGDMEGESEDANLPTVTSTVSFHQALRYQKWESLSSHQSYKRNNLE